MLQSPKPRLVSSEKLYKYVRTYIVSSSSDVCLLEFIGYSLRPKMTVVFAFRETTLTHYITIYINIYSSKLVSLDRYLNLVFQRFI